MARSFLFASLFSFSLVSFCQDNLLETPEWKTFFDEQKYATRALEITDATFWDFDGRYTYYTEYPLLLIFQDGTSEEIQWEYDGLNNLLYKKHTITTINDERIEKENIAYMVFDGLLLKNPQVGNMIDGDFMIVYKKGPMSICREYYTSPIERGNISSALAIYHLSEKEDNFQLGIFEKKMAKVVKDYPRLAKKVKDEVIGYRNSVDDILRIADEYNAWVKENYPYRYEDHTWMFWESRF